MALIKCPECGNDVSDLAQACPRCGRPLNPYRSAGPAQATVAPTPMATATAAQLRAGRVVVAILISFFTLGYMIPWSIAYARRSDQQAAIFLINLFLGWTFIGWVAALIWAFTSHVEQV